ncbi:aminotransferase [Corynebacterium tapiri]|uniref:Aminotransferase n=1 Tax=Corynebacterium tapiri TaxID=1448266 RepID=A0A5C4U366_9CORY|nr:aminotransferase [Corynebacterium tapiri]TNL97388.1 aminotransferase [Corynebacterium tapiri]
MSLLDLDADQRAELLARVRQDYEELKASNLNLDLTRGKPSSEQLDVSHELLSLPGEGDIKDASGADVRNYGNLKGITDIRQIWADLLGIKLEQIVAGDASSLNIMFDLISASYIWGTNDSERPWSAEEKVKWICPVPGYDRHFTITEKFGFEMITVPWLEDGPDLNAIREAVKDPQVKGMWVVPMFANPTGQSVSADIARGLAEMETAAPDFRIIWDNAYAVHTLSESFPTPINVLELAEQAGNPNRFWHMASTSKITHAGAGVSFFASSEANLAWYLAIAGVRGIGPNKVNQLAHARFFHDAEGVRVVMRKHASLLAPKFRRVLDILESNLGEYDIARWTTPEGGYFISVDLIDGTAARVVELAREAGIKLTEAGSSFPLHDDPNDRNLRLAPSMPPINELEQAMKGFTTCALLAALEKLEA